MKIKQINKRVKRCAVNKNDRVAQCIRADPRIRKTKANTVECITKQSTKNFRSDTILGEGGFGKVYKGR
ncbi:hypothetical protein L1987_57490 [Smallanthus sonchifolius]|uniref:Uncharacterized protein n=1 Tax=Smallanthus sonchifolius TaxID=185202 RepID=A0ACB9DD53_9ASTR|nr:hypothetical protein L1987_57490 [Smallanthus sonchifolius]